MIYLIKEVGKPVCKIGYGADPWKRIKQLQTGNQCVLKIVSIIHGDILYERAIHAKFSKFHLRGEWFTYDKSIVAYFKSNIQVEKPKAIKTNGRFNTTTKRPIKTATKVTSRSPRNSSKGSTRRT